MRLVVMITVVSLLAVACGGGGTGGALDARSDPSETGALALAKSENDLFWHDRDLQAVYRTLEPSCREVVSYGDFAAELTLGLAMVSGFLGIEQDQMGDVELENMVVSGFTGTEAFVAGDLMLGDLMLSSAGDESPNRYVFVDGEWWSTCDDLDAYQTATASSCSDLVGADVATIIDNPQPKCVDSAGQIIDLNFQSRDCNDGSTLWVSWANWFGLEGGVLADNEAGYSAATDTCYGP